MVVGNGLIKWMKFTPKKACPATPWPPTTFHDLPKVDKKRVSWDSVYLAKNQRTPQAPGEVFPRPGSQWLLKFAQAGGTEDARFSKTDLGPETKGRASQKLSPEWTTSKLALYQWMGFPKNYNTQLLKREKRLQDDTPSASKLESLHV